MNLNILPSRNGPVIRDSNSTKPKTILHLARGSRDILRSHENLPPMILRGTSHEPRRAPSGGRVMRQRRTRAGSDAERTQH